MHQLSARLFTPAIDAITLSACWEYPGGWRLSVAHRHNQCDWSECPVDHYAELVTEEAADVTCAVVHDLLGFPRVS